EIFKVSPLVQTPFLSSRDMAAAIRRVYVRFYLLSPRHFVLLGKALLRRMTLKTASFKWLRVLRGNVANAAEAVGSGYAR
ncbi:MAG: hypothetical protein ABII12_01690, partial [Planctomycetota bacterium]